MKKYVAIFLTLILIQTPALCSKQRMEPISGGENKLPNIFIYTIPEEDSDNSQSGQIKETPEKYINNDTKEYEKSEEEILLDMKQEPAPDDNTVLGATVLKGYAEYIEDSEAIYLKDDNNEFVLNLKVPQKITASEGLNLSSAINSSKTIDKYADTEYHIAPKSVNTSEKMGDFTFGALYGNEVDNIAMLESETGLFTKYEKNKFALSSSYKKNLNSTYNQFYDTISIAPELKLNNYMSIKNEYKADITRNRKSGSIIFSINPLAKKDKDRWILEVGAKHTIYADNVTTKSELNFSTKFKL